MQTPLAGWNLWAGWVAALAGVISGAVIGLFFQREEWLGGYASYRRRLLRLGHISFFGLGFSNILFGLTVRVLGTVPGIAVVLMIASVVTMPICCFLTAWRTQLRVLFPLPVVSAAAGILMLLMNWKAQ
jgi:hypothetical protein